MKKILNNEEQQTLGRALYTPNKLAKALRDFDEGWNINENDSFINEFLKFKGVPENIFVENGFLYYDNDIQVDVKEVELDIGHYEKEQIYLESLSEEEIKEKFESKKEYEDEIHWYVDCLEEYQNALDGLHEAESILQHKNFEKDKIYELKNKLLKSLDLTPECYHSFDDDTVRPLYRLGDFEFHGEDVSGELEELGIDPNEVENLGEISSEFDPGKKMPVAEAFKIVEAFVESLKSNEE